MKLTDYLDRGATFGPGEPCLIDAEDSFSFREAVEATWRIAAGMHARGANRGTRAAVLANNSVAGFLCILGILRLGATWIPLNALHSVEDHDHFLTTTECEWLFYETALEDRARRLAAEVPSIQHLIPLSELRDGGRRFGSAQQISEMPADAGDDGLCILFASGGTTGRSKAVMWTLGMIENLVANFLIGAGTGYRPVHLVVAPISHAAGVVALPLMAIGGSTVILPKVDSLAIMEAIERHRVTTLFLPPTAIYNLLAHPRVRDFDYSSLRNFVYAAAPMSVDKLKQALDVFGPVMTQTFGQAEAPLVCTMLTPAEHMAALAEGDDRRLGSCGRPCPLNTMAILDDEGRELANNERGEIAVRSALVTPGYYGNPEATKAAFKNGWLCTGDIGHRDDEGFYYIVDRKRDMIITGGYNVFPSEVEQVLWSHESVQDCAVIGVPDERWGESVKAIVELKAGRSVDPEALIALCRERLGAVRAPKSVEIWEALPRSPNGKVLKREVRDTFWSAQERKV